MSIDYSQIADFLRAELQRFLRTVKQTEDDNACRAAAEQLQAMVNSVEAFSYAPEEDQWSALSESQRWGYLRLESYMGTALHELRRARDVQDSKRITAFRSRERQVDSRSTPALLQNAQALL